jgi:hypothetical protein
MISEKKMLETYTVRHRWLTEYAHQQMEKHGLFAEGWEFKVASFYEEEMRERNGLDKLLGLTVFQPADPEWEPYIKVYPNVLRLAKRQQKQTVLHEIAHALVAPIVGTTEDHHGPTWLQQCGRIMPASMFWWEFMAYGRDKNESVQKTVPEPPLEATT